MSVMVTGAAGFIGNHVCEVLLNRGETVVGVDNMNDYYDVALKEARLARIADTAAFTFEKADISDKEAMTAVVDRHPHIDRVVHLAAQAGVRHSLIDPYSYTMSNVHGQVVMLEACRRLPKLDHFVYASSSSVYGDNTKLPFSVDDRCDTPRSLYAATKKACELIGHSYGSLYGLPQTGLRFFTVYGPWGRPDMAAYIFTRKILAGEPIEVFNNGKMQRDFTYIDDIVSGVIGCLDSPSPADNPHRVYNIGNNNTEPLMRFIEILQEAIGIDAILDMQPMQPGDVPATYADIDATRVDFGFEPTTPIDVGLPKFVAWYRRYHGN